MDAFEPMQRKLPRRTVDKDHLRHVAAECLNRAVLETQCRSCGVEGEEGPDDTMVEVNNRELLATLLDIRTHKTAHLAAAQRRRAFELPAEPPASLRTVLPWVRTDQGPPSRPDIRSYTMAAGESDVERLRGELHAARELQRQCSDTFIAMVAEKVLSVRHGLVLLRMLAAVERWRSRVWELRAGSPSPRRPMWTDRVDVPPPSDTVAALARLASTRESASRGLPVWAEVYRPGDQPDSVAGAVHATLMHRRIVEAGLVHVAEAKVARAWSRWWWFGRKHEFRVVAPKLSRSMSSRWLLADITIDGEESHRGEQALLTLRIGPAMVEVPLLDAWVRLALEHPLAEAPLPPTVTMELRLRPGPDSGQQTGVVSVPVSWAASSHVSEAQMEGVWAAGGGAFPLVHAAIDLRVRGPGLEPSEWARPARPPAPRAP